MNQKRIFDNLKGILIKSQNYQSDVDSLSKYSF